jgi:X-X-X-Leu-X-X-Gly heptad repeat protein
MSSPRRALLASVTAVLLATLNAAPGLSAQDQTPTTPQPPLVSEQLVTAVLDPSGLPTEAQLFNRIVATDVPTDSVTATTSTVDLRYLDRTGAPPVNGTTVTYSVGGPGQTTASTQALFDKPLPVAFHAEYATSGVGANGINPNSVTGRDGDLAITYTATNTDVVNQPITYTNAAGNQKTKEQPVFAPFVGTVIATLPSDIELRDAGTAVVSTTTEGLTALQWNLVLYPPLGSFQQVMAFQISGNDLTVPAVRMEVIPVSNSQDPAVGFSSTLLSDSVTGSTELAGALTELDDSTLQLAAGARDLAAAQDAAVAGTESAATGSAGIALGADQLTKSLGDLSSGLDDLAGPNGLSGAVDATAQLAEAVSDIADIIGADSDPSINPEPPLPSRVTLVQASRVSQTIAEGLQRAANEAAADDAAAVTALQAARAKLCDPPATPSQDGCGDLTTALINASLAAVKSSGVASGLTNLNTQVLAKITNGLIAVSTRLKSTNGQSVYSGLEDLEKALAQAVEAVDALAAGSASAVTGADGLSTGTSDLADGLGELAAGSNVIAQGSEQLSGLAVQLQTEGTSQVLSQVIDSSSQPALANAYLTAASDRAGDASPYPPPTDAVARVAYVYSLDPPAPEAGISPAAIAIGLIVLAALVVVMVRRLRRPSSSPA